MKKVFLAWQDPQTRRWLPVGQLSWEADEFKFVYTRGAESSKQFVPFGRMTDLHAVYVAKELFPLFSNRLLPKSRPEYGDFLGWLGLGPEAADDLELLSRSGGARATDQLQVFPCPEPTPDNRYVVEFFSRGIRHLLDETRERIAGLEPGERLFLMQDIQNPADPMALMMRTGDPVLLLGYCPRFYSAEFSKLIELVGHEKLEVRVAGVNPGAPMQLRLRCRLSAPWPPGFAPCNQDVFAPLG